MVREGKPPREPPDQERQPKSGVVRALRGLVMGLRGF